MTNELARILWVTLLVAACGGTSPPPPVATQQLVPATAGPTAPPLRGSGVITFGTGINQDTLVVKTQKTSFKTSSTKIAWSASLSDAAGATSLTLILAKVTSSGVETIISKESMDVSNPTFDTFANEVDLALLVNRKAGTYVMRILRDTEVLAEGKFTLTK